MLCSGNRIVDCLGISKFVMLILHTSNNKESFNTICEIIKGMVRDIQLEYVQCTAQHTTL